MVKNKKIKINEYDQKRIFSNYIKKAGIESDFELINKKIIKLDLIFIFILNIIFIIIFTINKTFFSDAIKIILSLLTFGFALLYLIFWLGFFVFIDFKIYQRKKEIESVFPDFLQLAAANINAGMPIDRALWYAIRPKFGILAKEMEQVAKSTMTGDSLNKALIDFSNKYDSLTIKRTINLILEGLESGGEIGELLIKVADNLRETEILKKEMASSVTTYVIFILFATLGAAPFLFGLTTELVLIMGNILSNLNVGETTQSFGGLSIGKGNVSVSFKDYQIFAMTSVVISCIFAAMIISIIQKGNVKEALKNIPIYIAIGLINYFISFNALRLLLGGFFA